MNEKVNTTLAKFSAIGIYLLIAFEFFYMASPFAMYFYSVYKPGLGFLNKVPFLAWSTGFFMPHLVVDTKSVLLNFVFIIGTAIASLGFLLFLVCAFQIYYSKLFKKKVVTGGIYQIIRHPQYTAFAICSFGLLLLWPRYLTLILYIVLLFVYYWLAIKEEKECVQKFGKEYLLYKERTAMFFPFPKWLRTPEFLSLTIKQINVFVKYIVVTAIALIVAIAIKKICIAQLYTYSTQEETWLAIHKTGNSEFENVSRLINSSEAIKNLTLKKAGDRSEFIFYMLPAEMYISEIPMIKPKDEECHVESKDFDHSKIKIIITRGIHKNTRRIFTGKKLLEKTLILKPIAEVWADIKTGTIIKIVDLPESERYTNIPEPIF